MKFTEFVENEPDRKNLMIVDSLNLAFRFKHANKKEFANDFLFTVISFAKSYEAKKVIVAGDMGSSWRKSIFPDYKANRKELRERQTEEEKKEFEEFLQEVDNALEKCREYGYIVFKFLGVEADDIAAYITTNYSKDYEHTWLISSDKDWDLLVCDNVSRFSYRTRKETTMENWNEHYIYDPEEHLSIKVLTGDKGDNVPGVQGVGEKRAYAILREYGPTALDVYDNLPLPGKQKFIQNLNAFGEQILLNYQLMDLTSFCIDALNGNHKEIDEVLNEN